MAIKKIAKMGSQMKVQNPYIIGMYHHDIYPPGNEKMEPSYYLEERNHGDDFNPDLPWRMYYGDTIAGFPVHPHRGVETITILLKGFADHFDSKGSRGRYGEGDVQWMTTGAGLQHSEMFPLLSDTEENHMHWFQIWLNLPAKSKFVKPEYKMFWNEKTPVLEEFDEYGKKYSVKIIAGKYRNKEALAPPSNSWAAEEESNMNIWIINLDPLAQMELPAVANSSVNRSLYYYEGESLMLGKQTLKVNHYAELSGDESINIINGNSPSKLLLLEGSPINEPVAAGKSFVMNTEEELEEAYDEYELTQFGGWFWDRPDPVNDKDAGRFATYSKDGEEERP